MADAGRGGFGRGFGEGGGDKGKGKGKDGKGEEKEWVPCTKLGRLVRDGKIRSMEQVFLFSLPIKEYQITDLFMGDKIKDEVMQIMPVQKQTSAGQRTRFKCVVAVGDFDGHIGMGTKAAKEVATAIRGGINAAKCGVVPVRRGYWGAKIGLPHTVPVKLTGRCGSVRIRLIPAARASRLLGCQDWPPAHCP